MEKLSYEIASGEVSAWLNRKKIPQHKRDKHKDAVESLEEAVASGQMVIDESGQIKYSLQFPVKDNEGDEITELSFKPRLTAESIAVRMKNVEPGDIDRRIMAYVQALTGKSSQIIGQLDTVDLTVCQHIASFFY